MKECRFLERTRGIRLLVGFRPLFFLFFGGDQIHFRKINVRLATGQGVPLNHRKYD